MSKTSLALSNQKNNNHNPNLSQVISLPRGGYLVNLSIGTIQVGSPPETIKDTLLLDTGVPGCYCVSDVLFDWNRGLSYCELEFPVYYNYFLRNRKTSIVCSSEHERAIRNLLTRGAFGMQETYLSKDYAPQDQEKIFDILSELHYFREERSLEDLVTIEVLDKKTHSVQKGSCLITKTEKGDFLIHDREISNEPIYIPGHPNQSLLWNTPPPKIKNTQELHIPQWFSVLPVGTSHGFDPLGRTSGFLFWIEGKGVLVDPPAGTTKILRNLGIEPRLINSLIVTHTHADHDSGILEKLLEEKKIHVYSTQSVFQIWLDKYQHMTGLCEDRLLEMMHFHPVHIGRPVEIHGAEFIFSYRLHSVPTVGFSIKYNEKRIIYSGDHLNDPMVFGSLYDNGIISKSRYEELKNFSWDADLIYHEAGVPPIHTRLDYLATLPTTIQKKIFVYHISKRDFEVTSSKLHQAKENELFCVISNKKTGKKKIQQALVKSILSTADGWEDLPSATVEKYIKKGKIKSYESENIIIPTGIVQKKMHVIIRGTVVVNGSDGIHKIYGPGQTIALRHLVLNTVTTDKYKADSCEVVIFEIDIEEVKTFLQSFSIGIKQEWITWKMLGDSYFCKQMTYRQQTLILDSLQCIEATTIIELENKNPLQEGIFLYANGKIQKDGVGEGKYEKGDLIFPFWEWIEDLNKATAPQKAIMQKNAVVFYLSGKAIQYFLKHQPGVLKRVWKRN